MTLPREILSDIRYIEIRARKVVNSLFGGEYHSIFKGRGMEFSEVRPYAPGDDPRTMDWNVTARTGDPYVKVFNEERELTLMLLVDLSASGRFGSGEKFKSEIAAELCAVLAFSAIRNNDRVGLVAFTDKVGLYIAPKKGRKHVLRLIRELLYFRPEGRGTDIAVALDYMNGVLSKKSIAFLVSDFRAENYHKQLKATGAKHDLVAVRLRDPREESIPDMGVVALRDAETGELVYLDTSDKALMEEFETSVRLENEQRDRLFRKSGVDQILIDTTASYVEPLVSFFKKREKRLRFG